jgi:hypothetical protein
VSELGRLAARCRYILVQLVYLWAASERSATFHIMSSHNHDHRSALSEIELRVRALETLLIEKGYVEAAALDRIVEAHETRLRTY